MARSVLNNRLTALYSKESITDKGVEKGEQERKLNEKDDYCEKETRKRIKKSVRDVLNEEFGVESDSLGNLGQHFSFENPPKLSLKDIAGIENIIRDIEEFVIRPLKFPDIYKAVGVNSPCGVLLQGPPGTGKSYLSMCIAGELGLPFFKLSGPNIISGVSGTSEASLRKLFDDAIEMAPCLIIIDEIDIVTPKREGSNREMERRLVSQFANCLDKISGKFIVVVGTTSRPDSIDPIIRRNGRMDREISMPMPDENARKAILQVLCKDVNLSNDVDFREISRKTPGFVGADLKTLINEAALIRVNKLYKRFKLDNNTMNYQSTLSFDLQIPDNQAIPEIAETPSEMTDGGQTSTTLLEKPILNNLSFDLSSCLVSHEDILEALENVTPSSRREGFTTIPDISWENVGALNELRVDLELRIISPIKNSHIYDKFGLETPSGVLLYGPPGCGKTLLAKAIAKESGANFISIRGPELLNKYVGESEKAVRTVFERARASAPCIVFFDELDSLCAARSSEGNGATERVVNQLLTELDGVGERRKVFVVAATNRPDIIDPAMMRPGRLDRVIYVPLPNEIGRLDILTKVSKKTPLAKDVDLRVISKNTQGFSGADLSQLIREATLKALDKLRTSDSSIFSNSDDFESRINNISGIVTQDLLISVISGMKPSVREEQINFFENLKLGQKLTSNYSNF
ncbi:ATPase family associated with various cellular activities (AAA) family protein [Cryptosporidium meleagridis]|uniref:ATPase family associated with various cellular activities (AAA) family protein n=1 Tax=Cryptosporidium meleagridis TaxID=93969 RepID=A0A2P4Z3M2_9CRYT|nr:ATPase family associated with various cellular activities (AAA) family protein [Cryptosporidium meleagridis]